MSDQFQSNIRPTKVIGVKSIDDFKTEDEINNKVVEIDKHQEVESLSQQIETLRAEKTALIEKTRANIESEKAAWQSEKEELINAAKEEGYKAGFEEGKQDSIESYQHTIDKANTLADASMADYYATVEQSSNAILSLAIHSAEKIVNEHLQTQPDDYINIVKQAITELKQQDTISIYLAPDNYEFVLKQKEELLNLLGPNAHLALYIQEDFALNHCLIVHPHGQLDASVNTQLSQIRAALETAVTETNK